MTVKKKGFAIVLRIFLIIFGAALVFEGIIASTMRNFNLGILMPIVIGAPLVLLGIFYTPITRFFEASTFGKIIKWGFIAAYALFALLFSFTTVLILKNSAMPKDTKADAVIVLGAAVRGSTPSVQLAFRLERALEYHRENPDAVIVVSGGQGHDEAYPEAEVMKKWLVARGIPEERIIEELQATSTEENFLFSKALIDKALGGTEHEIAFVTNRFHVFRSERIAKKLGIDAFGIAASEFKPTLLNDYLRECAAIVQYFLSGKL